MKNYQHIWFFLKSGETEFFSKNLWIGWSSHGFALSLKTIDFTVYSHIIQPFYILQGTYFNWKKIGTSSTLHQNELNILLRNHFPAIYPNGLGFMHCPLSFFMDFVASAQPPWSQLGDTDDLTWFPVACISRKMLLFF